MKLTLRRDLGGYALDSLASAGIEGLVLDKPFTLFTGPNGSGKSAIMRGIRASLGLRGERIGQTGTEWGDHSLTKEDCGDDVQRSVTQVKGWGEIKPARHVPAVFDLADLGWKGNPTYLFDSREASGIAKKASLEDDIGYHVSLIAGGGSHVSHGQFVSKTWWEAIEWASGVIDIEGGWIGRKDIPIVDAALGGASPSPERWLFLDEPETALDANTLVLGLSVLLEAAEIGKLRIFCASHSLLFASGLAVHEKIQTVDLGGASPWLETQKLALRAAQDHQKLSHVGQQVLADIRKAYPPASTRPRKR